MPARAAPSSVRAPPHAKGRAPQGDALSPLAPLAPLAHHQARRDFTRTPEPRGEQAASSDRPAFVIQKHDATRLHYDFRLELDGVLLSWAVPKGPSLDPSDKRMAVRTEDHPLSYAGFEGSIPAGQYGAGDVIVWDRGHWQPDGDPRRGLAEGKLKFELQGHKLHGAWELIRLKHDRHGKQDTWLLFKRRDEHARSHDDVDVTIAMPDSVLGSTAPTPDRSTSTSTSTSASSRGARSRKRPAMSLPESLSPQLAMRADAVPADGPWVYEVKFDGYRLLARLDGGGVRLVTRNGHDWTSKMPAMARELAALKLDGSWLDGELVVIGDDGLPDFHALQNAIDRADARGLRYFVFDALFLHGEDLRKQPLRTRRERLRAVLRPGGQPENDDAAVRFSDDFGADAASVLQSACRLGLEGVIAKRADAPYRSSRSTDWLKLKCQERQEFVVGGYTDRANARGEVGSLLLGLHDDTGRLVSVGSVGTGWNTDEARRLHARLVKLKAKASPFAVAPPPGRWTRRTAGGEHWVRPTTVVEVAFAAWTPEGRIRHASYVALRTDKPAASITREPVVAPSPTRPATPTKARSPAMPTKRQKPGPTSRSKPDDRATVPGVTITHPDRVIDPSTGITKLDVARYVESVAAWLLPELDDRPVSLVRAPDGLQGPTFFQKHGEKIGIPGIRELDPALWPGHDALLEIDSVEALVGAAQMNVIEFHTWNARTDRLDRPDRVVFDLDPGEGVAWPQVQEGAQLVRAMLDELGLQSWLKTSGGKGLHVVVPIARRWSAEQVKAWSQAVVQHLARTIPDRFVATSGPKNRVGRIFVDYLRNGQGATTVAAYSPRARPGMGVSMPVSWDDLPALTSGAHWTLRTARDHLSFRREDPWAGFGTARPSLAAAMKRLKPA